MAAIKMDELLVSWLASDSMYENVLNLIEENKLAAQKQQQQQQQQHQQQQQQLLLQDGSIQEEGGDQTVDGKPANDKEAASKDGAEDTNSNSSPRCVIPKFYLGDPSRPRRRRRLLPMPQSDTWEPLPEGEKQAPEDSRNFPDGTPSLGNNGSNANSSMGFSGDDAAVELTTVPSKNHAPMLCVREQVQALYAEIGQGKGDMKQQFIPVQEFIRVTKDIFRFPTFFNFPLCQRLLQLWRIHKNTDNPEAAMDEPSPDEPITYEMVEWYWLEEMEPYDAQERFFRLCKQPSADYIVRDDFLPFIKALLSDHPGLEFLSNHAEFQEKYAVTVITRIFYCVNKCNSGRVTCRQIRRSDLLDAFLQVDEEEDINKVTRYFSYEHFYVLYCRFWELDHDRDYRITREDLLKYGDHSLSHMIVDRIFDAAPRPFEQPSVVDNPNDDEAAQNAANMNREYLSYEDFIYFMLSEEDKANDVSVRYWFTSVDVDGDGRLNNMEMRSFYAVQLHRMQCMGHEIVPFEDMLCQMMDMIKPASTDCLVVEDFLQTECAPVAGALFDALFNLNKYLLFEQRDPFVERQKREDEFETDWDRFACIDYNRLAMEEEAREEEAMEIDWVTVDDEDEDGLIGSNAVGGNHGMQMQVQQPDDYAAGGYGGVSSSEAPF